MRSAKSRRALVFVAMLVARAAVGAEAPPAEGKHVDPAVLASIARAATFLRQQPRFSFSAELGYQVVQGDGSKLEFGEARRYTVERPDHVRIEADARDGARRLVIFDGRKLTQADLRENVYAEASLKKPRDLDGVIDLLRQRLDTPMPLADLLRNDPRPAIEDSLEAAYVVGAETLRGVACDHLALRNPDADIQLWISQGAEPLMRRIVIEYRQLDGQPEFWADLADWSFTPSVSAASFQYQPPAGSERVRFEVRAPLAPAPETTR